ncbi:FAD-binding protein [Sphingomonas sp. R647]|uniref:FAD-binding protein n=1 Tax=Sphingomonas sp. R647 TaxID=2875233 RepID=UPI001CD3D03E|nr:FAD-binding protein [Sphingomonas sp. R647]MCA1200129.1 FAD-binding protein [Sphingomonas sp. R647]
MMVESIGRVHAADVGAQSGLERFAATARPVMEHLRKLRSMQAQRPTGFAAGLNGRGWSFSPLIGAPVSQLACEGLAGTAALAPAEQDAGCTIAADRIALTSGGTRLRELVTWAETHNMTIRTSGTHLGATVAGAAGTASHGSRLGYGGIQDMVLGMHLIVSDDEHVWIERSSCPVLGKQGLARLTVPGATLRLVRDDDQFEDALIHLGAMGVVNGVAMELVPNTTFALLRRHDKLDANWLADLAQGAFDKIAARLHCAVQPEFYEITLNPHAPFSDDATHMMYVPRASASLLPPKKADVLHPSDAIGQLGEWLVKSHISKQLETAALLPDPTDPPTSVSRTLRYLLNNSESAFAFYRSLGGFEPNTGIFDPEDPQRDGHYWSGLHQDEITGNIPGALYNASYAIPLDHVAAAIPAICRAVELLEPSFVFSLRFVAKPAGTMAFTRFDHNAVIEIDGLSPLICKLAAAQIPPELPDAEEMLKDLALLAQTLEKGAIAVRQALEQQGTPFSMHWAKLGPLDKAKVHADFGHPNDSESLIRRWRDTRDALLPTFGRSIFWNDQVVALGLLDRPVAPGP